MDRRKEVQVIPKPDSKAENAFRRFMQTILDPGRKTYPNKPQPK